MTDKNKYIKINKYNIYTLMQQIPAMFASYAIPTAHLLLLAAAAITPAQFVPCLVTKRTT